MLQLLQQYSERIHQRYKKPPSSPLKAASKLLIAPRFRYSDKASQRVGWKKGELLELSDVVIARRAGRAEVAYEVADVVYYAAQSPALVRLAVRVLLRLLGWPWSLALEVAVAKYRLRASGQRNKEAERKAVAEIVGGR